MSLGFGDLPIQYEMRTADGGVVSVWMVLPYLDAMPCQLWRTDLNTGQRHRITGQWEEVRGGHER